MKTIWPAKDPAESLVAGFDFSADLDPGETLASVLCLAAVVSGADPAPATMLFTLPAFVDGVVLQPFRGGVAGADYVLRCEATLSSGRVLVLAARLPVRPA